MATSFPLPNSGATLPSVSFGLGTTLKNQHDPVVRAVLEAWEAGYRSFDGARFYGNESALGEAVQILMTERGVKREEITITTKVEAVVVTYEKTLACVSESLSRLRLAYVDVVMMHGPGPDLTLDYTRNMCSAEEFGALPRTREAAKEARLRVWEALQDLKAQGKVRSIGISNFVRRHIEDIVKDKRCTALPAVHQLECHPYFLDWDVLSCCREHGIVPQAYSPLGNGDLRAVLAFKPDKKGVFKRVLDDPVLHSIAESRGCTVAQVCLAWLLHRGIAVVTKSSSPARMRENLGAREVRLTDEDVGRVDEVTKRRQSLFLDNYNVL